MSNLENPSSSAIGESQTPAIVTAVQFSNHCIDSFIRDAEALAGLKGHYRDTQAELLCASTGERLEAAAALKGAKMALRLSTVGLTLGNAAVERALWDFGHTVQSLRGN